MDTALTPSQFVILGGSGDLSKKKLLPALLDLYSKGSLPTHFNIIGLARTPRTEVEYRQFVTDAIYKHNHTHSPETIANFCKHITYISGSFDENSSYQNIAATINDFKETIGQCTNVLFYLAVPPEHYKTIFEKIYEHKLSVPCDEIAGWARILVEKPFGHDRASAQALDTKLNELFKEEQIYRIDHYLAKEAIQNILSFRFANSIIESAWNPKAIEKIRIIMHETVDVSNRGSFYDDIGAVRDVGQNHLLQLLAVVTMDEPRSLDAEAIRVNRAQILENLVPYTKDSIKNNFRHAQYSGYKDTEGVQTDSKTDTAFCFVAHLDNEKWRDVPIYIEAGKALQKKSVHVSIQFYDSASGPFKTDSCNTIGNEIVLKIEPEQSMHITLNAKAPGLGYQIESRTLSFRCEKEDNEIRNSYERVLMDCILGDQTLFVTGREVAAQWAFINSIFEYSDTIELELYEPGAQAPFINKNKLV